MRKISGLVLSLASALSVSTALAAPLPVVAVNREVGLSMAGQFDNLVIGESDFYRSHPEGTYAGYQSLSHSERRRIGWTPGFQVDASAMYSFWGVENLYASAQFLLGQGNRNHKYRSDYMPNYGEYTPYSFGGSAASRSTYSRGEIGKGFLVLDSRFLLTPFIQGGYLTYGSSSFSGANSFFVGAGLNADYALTDRLVLRGRFGWAQLLDTGFGFRSHGSSPRWEGGLGVDYRFTKRLHLTAGGDYAYTDYGHDTRRYNWFYGADEVLAGSAFQNGATLHVGLAYQY